MNAETMTDKPAPCPKCQATEDDGLRTVKDGLWGVQCTCGMSWKGAFTEAEALTAWNARTVQAELVEALRSNVATMEEQRRRFTALGRSCAELTTAINETRTAITRATGAAS